MSANTPPLTIRVVLATQDPAELDRLIGQARVLAEALQAELAGLFVEEVDLLRLVALPIAREVSIATETVRVLDTASTVRLLQRRAAEVQQVLAREAAAANLPWSFTVTRGSLVDVALAAASGPDLVVFGPPRTALQHTVGQRTPRPGGRVATLYDATEAGQRALAAALRLSRNRPEAISLVITRVAEAESLRRLAAGRLQRPGWNPEVVSVDDLRRTPAPRALVVSLDSLGQGGIDLRQLVAEAGCPVILLR